MQATDKHKIRLRAAIDNIHPLGNECWSELEQLIYIKELKKNG